MKNRCQGNYILVVDDDLDARELMCRLMDGCGLEVREASNGSEAIQQIELGQPVMLVLDLMMPGVNGFDVIRWLDSHEMRDLPVIVHSAMADGLPKSQVQVVGRVRKGDVDLSALMGLFNQILKPVSLLAPGV